jgi:hypothetical protein
MLRRKGWSPWSRSRRLRRRVRGLILGQTRPDRWQCLPCAACTVHMRLVAVKRQTGGDTSPTRGAYATCGGDGARCNGNGGASDGGYGGNGNGGANGGASGHRPAHLIQITKRLLLTTPHITWRTSSCGTPSKKATSEPSLPSPRPYAFPADGRVTLPTHAKPRKPQGKSALGSVSHWPTSPRARVVQHSSTRERGTHECLQTPEGWRGCD